MRKKLPSPLYFLLFAFFFLPFSSFSQTYNEDDKEGLRIFLRQPSVIAGDINAQRLGLQISDTINWMMDELWVAKVTALTWNSDIPKRLIEIYGNNMGWDYKGLAGYLDCSLWTYLTRMRCTANNLTTLIANNNTALTHLYFRFNKLTCINVSNCPALEVLWCSSNQLTTLNIYNCPALKSLWFEKNLLTTLNVNNCTELNWVDCKNNQFIILDVGNIPALSHLECSSNFLSSINLNASSALSYLEINNNLLTTIDISNNSLLSELHINNNQITHLAPHSESLAHLECRNNNLVSLDVNNSPNLLHLDCRNNNLNSIELSNNSKLQQLYCENNELTSLDISNSKNLQELYCDNNELTALNVSNATKLEELLCKNNQLTTLDVTDCHALTHLDCRNNSLASISNIHNKNNLKKLICDNNQLTTLDVSNCTKLEELSCVNNQLTSLDVAKCKSIVHIDCRDNRLNSLDISSVGGTYLLHALWCSYNQMFFSGIPPTIPYPWEYVYWPQNTIEGGKIDYDTGIDLSKEYLVEGNYTHFSWFDITNEEEQPIELPNDYGFFSLTEEHIGKRLRCKMHNATFPWLTGNNILVYEVTIKQFCEAVNNLEAEKHPYNSILLTWSKPESNFTVAGYSVYRNEQLLNNELSSICSSLDENLPDGNYDYYVETHYTNGCISEKSNIVTVTVGVGIESIKNYELRITVYPNPTTGQLKIDNGQLTIEKVEIYDIYGRKVLEPPLTVLRSYDLTVLHHGIYFIKITTEKGTITKKMIKQ
ncbi:MAG: leucine-rich repeat domain-containing protein [Bacteroidales bacterium]|jgi:Leucine-rich repeat (LRR) protein|nr:leucine-rich repeat domain-containing protein [Bacteroidales bacterium]